MSAFAQFVLVAVALYLWESTMWLPLRGIALRRRWSGGKWKALDPASLIATRELGMIAMLPLPPDAGLAPCQAPPLLVDEDGEFLMESSADGFVKVGRLGWSDISEKDHHLLASGWKTRISSARCIDELRRAKQRGMSPEAAVRQAWRLALSPGRAGREWRRWKLVSATLRWNGLLLAPGFFVGLPLSYLYLGGLSTVLFAGWLWFVMAWTAAHLWWLGKRVYPGARSALRMDALLSLLVPFHAMRASEMAAAHAMGTTHPVGLILSTRDFENAWLGRFIRRALHPLPGSLENAALFPLLVRALSEVGKKPEDFDTPPDRSEDRDATCYCPRCHGMFLTGVKACADCQGLPLRSFR